MGYKDTSMCNSPVSAVVQEFFTQPPGQQDGTIPPLIADICPSPLHCFHRDEPQFTYTNPGGTNGFQQMKQAQQLDKMKMDRLLRKPRSKAYMDAVHRLDAGGHVHNQNKVNGIIDAIREEFPEVELAGVMLGIVSQCYLGKPYEVHTLDLGGGII